MQVYRRLRRRVTNRLSARRMRQKRAEERDAVAAEVCAGVPSPPSSPCKLFHAGIIMRAF
jgi:hypothetical protein